MPGDGYLAPGTWHQVHDAWYQVPGTGVRVTKRPWRASHENTKENLRKTEVSAVLRALLCVSRSGLVGSHGTGIQGVAMQCPDQLASQLYRLRDFLIF